MLQYHLDSLLYFFAVGGLFFAVSFWLPIKHGDIRWSRREDRHNILWLAAGFLFYFLLYGIWQLAAMA